LRNQHEITRAFVELADTLVDDYDIVDLMHVLAERNVELLEADGAGIILRDARQNLVVVASTSDEADLIELFVLQNSEGPCFDCVNTGDQVVNVPPAEMRRLWPLFMAKLSEHGFGSSHAFPLRLRDEVLGAVNLFSRAETALVEEEIAIAQGLADVATIGLLQQRAVHRQEVLVEQLQAALNSRIVIEQAKGVLAEREGIALSAAFEMMRAYSRRERELLRDTAEAVIYGRLDFDQLGGPTASPS
jgi:GAF domain-containing protein